MNSGFFNLPVFLSIALTIAVRLNFQQIVYSFTTIKLYEKNVFSLDLDSTGLRSHCAKRSFIYGNYLWKKRWNSINDA